MFVRLRSWVEDATAGIKIRADYHDTEDDNFAAGISNCVARDGQSTITNNLPMNSKRLTSLADPVDPQDAVTKAYDDLKLPLTGGTITGTLTVNGLVTSQTGYAARPGTAGPSNSNVFNFNWTGSGYIDAWVNASNIGQMCTVAYMEQRAQAWAAQYAAPKVNRAGDTMTGVLNTAVSGSIGAGGPVSSILVNGASGDWAAISFLSPGVFGGNFGLHPSGDFYCGGWSYGAGAAYKFWTTRNLNPIQNGRLTVAGQPQIGAGWNKPYNGGLMTAVYWVASANGAPPYLGYAEWQYLQLLTPGGWFTVGYA
jgi:hypothetical protein